jgi:hypothetical protein
MITNLSSKGSVKIIAYIAYKKPKAAPGLEYGARHLPDFDDVHRDVHCLQNLLALQRKLM